MSNKPSPVKSALFHPGTEHWIRSLRQFFSITRSFKSILTAFKEFPFIGWALLLLDEGIKLVKAGLNKKMPLGEKIAAFIVGPIKIALGTTSILLPLLITSAALAIAAPICGLSLAIIDCAQAAKGAIEKLIGLKKDSSKLKQHMAAHAVVNMFLGASIAVAMGFLLFFPGAQIIAASTIGALVIAKLVNLSIQYGKQTKPEQTKVMKDQAVGSDTVLEGSTASNSHASFTPMRASTLRKTQPDATTGPQEDSFAHSLPTFARPN